MIDGIPVASLRQAICIAWAELSEARARCNQLQIAAYRHPEHEDFIADPVDLAEAARPLEDLIRQDAETARINRTTAARMRSGT